MRGGETTGLDYKFPVESFTRQCGRKRLHKLPKCARSNSRNKNLCTSNSPYPFVNNQQLLFHLGSLVCEIKKQQPTRARSNEGHHGSEARNYGEDLCGCVHNTWTIKAIGDQN